MRGMKKNIIEDRWRQMEKKSYLRGRLAKMYPFKKEDVKHLEDPHVVDAALMRLARHVTLCHCMTQSLLETSSTGG